MESLLEATHRAEARHFWFRGLRRFLSPFLASAVSGIAAPRVLDAGCGTGCNLRLLPQLAGGFGIDLNPVGLRLAGRDGLTRVARANVAALPFADDSFDLVTSLDVLYALDDESEWRAVREMARVLKPGGTLVVNVAALAFLSGGHSVLAREVRRYDRPTLRATLERSGLEVARLTYTNVFSLPVVFALRLAHRLAGAATPDRTGLEIAVPPAPVNAAFDVLLRLEALLLRFGDLPCGSSLLCVARKPVGAPRR